MRETSERFELNPGEWRLMAHLRYGGPPYLGKPGKLSKYLGLSTGAMTNRLDNMERRGLIRRLDDPDDRRGVIIELDRRWQQSLGGGGRRAGGEGVRRRPTRSTRREKR